MRLVFLGTSSATPTPRRFLSAAVLERDGELFQLDCGEGAQIGFLAARLRFSRLRWILISHMHGDHVTGLMGLLMSIQMAERIEPITIIGPLGIKEYVLANKRFLRTDFAYDIDFIELGADRGVVAETEAYEIEAARLDHRVPTFGFAVVEKDRPGRFDLDAARALGIPPGPLYGQLQSGRSITLADGTEVQPDQVLGPARPGRRVAYVPDTRPCANAVWLAHGADLLVHESTFGAELADEARKKKHSTAIEAAQTARDAGAVRLVLTHFSPRYLDKDLELLRSEATQVFPEVEVAKDLREFEIPAVE